ncbi:hypothetical protein AOC05_01290 [Arthrobacter alpinus]|uniref:Copper chaperone PCu(A)C n=1 Tax=Arthrobacter alpinus TaxID=656366 RepID=A0A0M5LWX3_9MICC|nr:copper chaperone PCu(A)C [Arthrobacter alpinus]ALE91300.1 hypothetical protein AOC05_01290 [Arthrobacter alpinus]
MNKISLIPALSLLAAASLALAGCGAASNETAAPASITASHGTPAVTVSDAWIKASESGMTGAFGVISNSSDADVTVVSAATDISPMVELHETVPGASGSMQMRAKEGGFTVPSKGTFKLEPGANHIMLMGLQKPIKAGDDVTFTLKLSDGGTLTFTAPGKDFSGANENYDGGSVEDAGHGGMEHGDSSHSTPESDTSSHTK